MSTDKGYLPDSLSLRELASRTRRLALVARSGGMRERPITDAETGAPAERKPAQSDGEAK